MVESMVPRNPGRRAARRALPLFILAWFACDSAPPNDSSPGSERIAPINGRVVDPPTLEQLERFGSLGISADAKLDTLKMLEEDRVAVRHPSDGGGRVWIDSLENADDEGSELRAGDRVRVQFTYQAGPLGIDVGGRLYLQISPFWGWDSPQNIRPDSPGYSLASTDAEGVEIESEYLGDKILAFEVRGRRLESGEQIQVTYGAGPAFARIDRFAERRARIWFAVDGDGDGIRKLIENPPSIDILAGAAARLVVVVPTSVKPKQTFEVRVSVLDRFGSVGTDYTGEVELSSAEGLDLPKVLHFGPEHGGMRIVSGKVEAPGIYRVMARARLTEDPNIDEEFAWAVSRSNPMIASADASRLLWADLHGHSQLSDGTGTPDDYFIYARDVAGLDVVSLTDHDHWGMRFLDASPDLWEEIQASVAKYHQPGRFVALLGYEWTSWLHGHRHVLYFDGEGEVLSTLDERYENPAQLWEGLRGTSALTFAHHSAGGPISTNWKYRPDPAIEPVTEIVSVHGSSEDMNSSVAIYNPIPGNFVRDVLDLGMRFGFIGSGDSHDGHPGESHFSSPGGGGLAAIFSETKDRESIRAALLERRVYATNGARIWLEVEIDGNPMGSTLRASKEGIAPATQRLRIRVVGESTLERIEIVRSGQLASIELEGEVEEWSEEREIPALHPGDYHYVRVVQHDGGRAWSSPIFTAAAE